MFDIGRRCALYDKMPDQLGQESRGKETHIVVNMKKLEFSAFFDFSGDKMMQGASHKCQMLSIEFQR
jgi:hypothetical protein